LRPAGAHGNTRSKICASTGSPGENQKVRIRSGIVTDGSTIAAYTLYLPAGENRTSA